VRQAGKTTRAWPIDTRTTMGGQRAVSAGCSAVRLLLCALCAWAGPAFAAETGALYVKSTPPGASIYVDGSPEAVRRTPCVIADLQPGTHALRATLQGHAEARASVQVKAGTVVKVELVLDAADAAPTAAATDGYLALVEKGDYESARRRAEESSLGAEAAEAARELERRAEAARLAAAALVGQKASFRTKAGVRSGVVEGADGQGIALAARIEEGGRVLGETRFAIPWAELSAEDEDRLSRAWKPQGAPGALALALVALRRGDMDAMAKALSSAGEGPLARRLRERLAAARAESAESAAQAAWRQLAELAKTKLDPAKAKRLEQLAQDFEQKHSGTSFAKAKAGELAELRLKAQLATAPSFPFNYALAANGATASGGSRPEELIDGNHTAYDGYHGYASTNWTASPPQHMVVTLARPTPINVIRFKLWDGSARYYQYRLEVSPEPSGDRWVLVADATDKEYRSWQVVLMPLQIVSRIRLTGVFNSANSDFHVVELQAYHAPAGFTREQIEEALARPPAEPRPAR